MAGPVVDTNGLRVRLGLTAGEAHDGRLAMHDQQAAIYQRREQEKSTGVRPAGLVAWMVKRTDWH
jgi:hypothetical protein